MVTETCQTANSYLLFYHLELRCYVVVELKNVDFEPEFIGQLQFYVTAVDETLKKECDNNSIGLLLCKKKASPVAISLGQPSL